MFGKSFFDKGLEFADLLDSLQVVFLYKIFKNNIREVIVYGIFFIISLCVSIVKMKIGIFYENLGIESSFLHEIINAGSVGKLAEF